MFVCVFVFVCQWYGIWNASNLALGKQAGRGREQQTVGEIDKMRGREGKKRWRKREDERGEDRGRVRGGGREGREVKEGRRASRERGRGGGRGCRGWGRGGRGRRQNECGARTQ